MWYIRGGRGSGKTRAGAEALAGWIRANPGKEWAIIAPTFGDARDTGMEGAKSGLLRALGLPRGYRHWNRSHGELFLPDGGIVHCDGADDGALRIQGKNLAGAWCDEVGLWRQWRLAWEESIAYAVRIDPARIVATGTPKRGHPLVKILLHDESIPTTRMRTLDNAANLSRAALADLVRRYGGTTVGRQELEGEELDEVDGALWTRDLIRYGDAPSAPIDGVVQPDYVRVVIAIDPAVTYGPNSDETGILVCAKGSDARGYVLADASGRFSVGDWRKRVIALYDRYKADLVVAEVNNGGDMVGNILRGQDWAGPYKTVTATRAKRVRAEPISRLYEQGLISHVKPFPELEDQLCTFTNDTPVSPDRLDALVWAFHELMLDEVGQFGSLIA